MLNRQVVIENICADERMLRAAGAARATVTNYRCFRLGKGACAFIEESCVLFITTRLLRPRYLSVNLWRGRDAAC